jgi:hypothetical protein
MVIPPVHRFDAIVSFIIADDGWGWATKKAFDFSKA